MSTDQLAERGQGKNRRHWQQVLPQTTVSGRYKFSFKHFDKVTNFEDSISFEVQKNWWKFELNFFFLEARECFGENDRYQVIYSSVESTMVDIGCSKMYDPLKR